MHDQIWPIGNASTANVLLSVLMRPSEAQYSTGRFGLCSRSYVCPTASSRVLGRRGAFIENPHYEVKRRSSMVSIRIEETQGYHGSRTLGLPLRSLHLSKRIDDIHRSSCSRKLEFLIIIINFSDSLSISLFAGPVAIVVQPATCVRFGSGFSFPIMVFFS